MALEFKVCKHPRREEIDRLLIEGIPLRDIAGQAGQISKSSLARHKEHLPSSLVKAQEAAEVARADDLLGQLKDLQARTLGILNQASDDHRLALAAIAQARANIELLGKLLGELREQPVVNLLLMPEWVSMRGVILRALQPYPDAKLALVEALSKVERHAGP